MRAFGAPTFWMEPPAPTDLRFRRTPLLAAALAFAAGIATRLLTHTAQFPLILTLATLLLTTISLIALRTAPRMALFPTLSLWLVAGLWCAQLQPSPDPQSALLPFADGLSRQAIGRIDRIHPLDPATAPADPAPPPWLLEPGAWEPDSTAANTSLDLALTQIENITPDTDTLQPIIGGIRLTVAGPLPPLHCGDVITAPVRLRTPDLYRTPGAWSYADFLLEENIRATAHIHADKLHVLTSANPTLTCRLHTAQQWASTRLARLTHPAPHSFFQLSANDIAMLSAMLFGDRTGLRRDLRAGFERTGVFHLFVVSGMHVALLAAILFALLRRLRAPLALATLLTIATTTAYAALTGFGMPVQRALLMSTVMLLGRWLARDATLLQALGAAALAVLAFSPRALLEAGFQMTFLALIAVAGIALPLIHRSLAPWLDAAGHLDRLWLDAQYEPRFAQLRLTLRLFTEALRATPLAPFANAPALLLRALLRLAALLLISFAAEACMALPMAVYFHRATPFALPANLLSLPVVALLAPLALITFLVSLLSLKLAAVPAALTACALHAVNAIIQTLAGFRHADIRLPAPPPPAIAVCIALLAFATWSIRRRPRILCIAAILATALIPLLSLWPAQPVLHPGTLEVTAIDVAQGDSLLVVSPSGRTLLVDAGGPTGAAASAENAASSADRWDVGEEVVAPFLWSRRLRSLDAVLLTHAHSDHMGGLPAILRDFHPRELWLSIDPGHSADFHALLSLAAAQHITVRHLAAGDSFALDPAVNATVLSPERSYANPAAPRNDDSLVLRLDFGRASVLLEGDAERPSETAMLANHRISPVTLLKVAHHGSRTSTNPDFLAAAAPRAAIISSGAHNTFGHPRPEILTRLESAHTLTFRTDRRGTTTLLLTPDGGILSRILIP